MRIWDIHPGYLNRQSLLGEHRELHAIVSVHLNHKKGYARHPETLRWEKHLSGLSLRHDILVAEMTLRGFRHHSPLAINTDSCSLSWPDIFIDPPGEQFLILKKKYEGREPGRIPFPVSPQQLWAQHKYSVMAREPNAYRSIGATLAGSRKHISVADLIPELIVFMQRKPSAGRLLNAIQHLWGYVSDFESEYPADSPLPVLFNKIQILAKANHIKYLMESTALSELAVWIV